MYDFLGRHCYVSPPIEENIIYDFLGRHFYMGGDFDRYAMYLGYAAMTAPLWAAVIVLAIWCRDWIRGRKHKDERFFVMPPPRDFL